MPSPFLNQILSFLLFITHSFGIIFIASSLSREMEKYKYFLLQIQFLSLLYSLLVFCLSPQLTIISGNEDVSFLVSYSNFTFPLKTMPIVTALILYLGISLMCAHVQCFLYRLKAVEAVFVERPFSNLVRSLIALHSLTFLPVISLLFDAYSHLHISISALDLPTGSPSDLQLPLPFPVIPITFFALILFVDSVIIGLTIYNSIRVLSDPKMQDGKFFAHHKRALFELAAMIVIPVFLTLIGTEILSKLQLQLSILQIWTFLYSIVLSITISFVHLAYRKKIFGFILRPVYHIFPSLKRKKRSAIQEMLRQTMTSMRPVVEITSKNAMITLDPMNGGRKRNRIDSELSSTTSFS